MFDKYLTTFHKILYYNLTHKLIETNFLHINSCYLKISCFLLPIVFANKNFWACTARSNNLAGRQQII